MASHFDLNDLMAFRAVAELGNFRKAAESVHISQPAFSRRIEKLEQALGVRLLERSTRRVSLTVVGRDFDRQLRQILDALDTTLLGIRGVAATRMGEVTIAAVPSAVNYFLSSVIARYHERYPRVRVKIIDESANSVLLAVARGEADFGLNFVGSQEADVEFQPRDGGAVRGRLPPRPSAGEEAQGALGRTGAVRLHRRRQGVGQPPAAGPGAGRTGRTAPQPLRDPATATTMIGLVEAGLGVAVVPSMAMPAKDHPPAGQRAAGGSGGQAHRSA